MDYLSVFDPLLQFGTPYIFLIGAIFMRISAIAFFAPAIGESTVPTRVRLAVAIAITIVLAPALAFDPSKAPTTLSGLFLLYLAEAISGLLIGFALRIMIFILEIAGAMAAQHLSLSQVFGPTIGFDASSPFASILIMGALALAASAGIHFHLVNALAESYEVLPFGQFPGAADAGEWSAQRVGAALMKSLALASPFVILGFIYSLALAAASRAMPQLMAAFVGAPAITLAGIALLAVTAPIILFEWLGGLERVLADFIAGRL